MNSICAFMWRGLVPFSDSIRRNEVSCSSKLRKDRSTGFLTSLMKCLPRDMIKSMSVVVRAVRIQHGPDEEDLLTDKTKDQGQFWDRSWGSGSRPQMRAMSLALKGIILIYNRLADGYRDLKRPRERKDTVAGG